MPAAICNPAQKRAGGSRQGRGGTLPAVPAGLWKGSRKSGLHGEINRERWRSPCRDLTFRTRFFDESTTTNIQPAQFLFNHLLDTKLNQRTPFVDLDRNTNAGSKRRRVDGPGATHEDGRGLDANVYTIYDQRPIREESEDSLPMGIGQGRIRPEQSEE